MELAQTGFFTPRNQHLILGVLVALSLSLPVDGWVVPQPKANVWATLAKAMNQDHICLSATSANNHLSTCLVGIPFRLNEFPPIFLQKMRSANQVRSNYLSPEFRYNTYPVRNPFAFWVQYLQGLLSLSSDPTDLELLGSVNASFCIKFVYTPPKGQEQNYRHVRPVNMPDDWCEDTVEVTRPTSFGINHVTMPSDEDHEEEGLELEEVLEGTPEDEERNPDEEEHGLRLRFTEGLLLKDNNWKFVLVNIDEQGTWPKIEGFELQEDKVQQMPPWKYLGLEIGKRTIVLQKLEIKAKIKTLADVHQLCGALNWPSKVQKTRPQELVAELIRKARVRIRELAGYDFECIHIPTGLRWSQITKAMLEHLLQENEALQFALDSFTGQISIHRPAHKIFHQDAKFTLSLKSVQSRKPLEALTVFTDTSRRSHKSVMTWKDPQTQQWEADITKVEGSPQVAELAAVVRAFETFPEPFNLIMDSAYVPGVVSRAEQAILHEVTNTALFELFSKLVKLISHREQPFFVMHMRSHTDLPGFIAEGNRRADTLAAPAAMAPLPSIFEQAKLSHQLFHQNAPGLVRRFHITREQAKAIVATCPSCNQHTLPTLSEGVNPRGLKSCEVWQTDMTHVPNSADQNMCMSLWTPFPVQSLLLPTQGRKPRMP
ncbi:hypothetical protein DUI87_15837 [Hirundo rustica rustica]|uniref:Uncharacterized protein n=1 Tax=Hirundo rustica rustica TaxID=333673 RepID=A0A3M0JZP0_HIRRU|nr:hypothetical protein DUI87_15837 [Hirundo rustica rustica]